MTIRTPSRAARCAVLAHALALAILVSPLPAAEQGWKPFDQGSFDQARAAGTTVVLHCDASWCPICKAQRAILVPLLAQPEFTGVVGLVIDYDSAAEVRGAFHITKPSTVVVYKGAQEVGRSTGATDQEAIRALIRAGL